MPFDPRGTPPPPPERSVALPAALAFLWSAQPAAAQPYEMAPLLHVHEPFFVFPSFLDPTALGPHWHSLLAIGVLVACLLAACHRRMAKARHKERIAIFGVGRGEAFMLLDVLAHAVWRGTSINADRVERALSFACDLTEIDYTEDQLRAAAGHADRFVTTLSFSWMRDALDAHERRRIFETALAVMLESGPLSLGDRAFLRTLTRAIGLDREAIGDLQLIVPA